MTALVLHVTYDTRKRLSHFLTATVCLMLVLRSNSIAVLCEVEDG
jgi:hypothetical protein